ncbi:MAG: dienelactone hydrolase family protein [SAR324 cluster bacterium]|nr:dienelactone hydrolase family protein [SAR324 cluster bacterium]
MNEKSVSIPTEGGMMLTYIFHPKNNGSFPAVILYMDAPAIREELFDFCRRIARDGYYVLLPDMYYRHGKIRYIHTSHSDLTDEKRKDMFAKMASLSNKLVMEDTAGMLEFLKTETAAKPGPKGCIGYCMSGQFVVTAAGTYPDDFAAAASLYGVQIVTEKKDSPHLLASQIKGELYIGFAEHDQYVPDHVITDLKTALDREKVTYRMDVWPGTEHGFCFPQRPAYVEDAAEKVWKITSDLFKRRLQS